MKKHPKLVYGRKIKVKQIILKRLVGKPPLKVDLNLVKQVCADNVLEIRTKEINE